MPNTALIPALAKTLLSIAWADNELHPEEEQTLKEVVGLLPAMSAQEWAVIELYLIAPIGAEERDELLQQTLAHIRSSQDKRVALEGVDAMLRADGAVQPAEEAVARTIRDALGRVDVSPLGLLRGVVGSALGGRPRREQGLELWRSNPVFYALGARGVPLQTPDPTAELASLAAAIMAQVARISPATAAQARPVLVQALRADWAVPPELAERIADAALLLTRRNVDYHRVARELARRTSEAQRTALLDTLFAIANAADQVAPNEIDEIRVIADRLDLTRQQFVNAKVKIPSVDRGGL